MKVFITIVGSIGIVVGMLALAAPRALLASKGAVASPATVVWVREVGVCIFAFGVMAMVVRKHGPSPTLRAFFVGNALLHIGLLPIELLAWGAGTLTTGSGVVPSSLLHVVLGVTFVVLAYRMRVAPH